LISLGSAWSNDSGLWTVAVPVARVLVAIALAEEG
jgi:hypothetical protein